MDGYCLTTIDPDHLVYSRSRPPSGGTPCRLPTVVAARFAEHPTTDIEVTPGSPRRNCPLHCVWVDHQGSITEESYRYA